MIDIIVGVISAIAFGTLILWAIRPAARKWFEFPKYKMLEDEKRFSELEAGRDRRPADNPRH